MYGVSCFNLWLWGLWLWASFHLLICYLYIFLKVSHQVFIFFSPQRSLTVFPRLPLKSLSNPSASVSQGFGIAHFFMLGFSLFRVLFSCRFWDRALCPECAVLVVSARFLILSSSFVSPLVHIIFWAILFPAMASLITGKSSPNYLSGSTFSPEV